MESEGHRLHPFSWLFVLLTQLRTVALPLLILVFFKRGDSWELWGAAGAAVLALHAFVYSRGFRYRLGDGELLVREGIFARTERHIPYARIQNIVQLRNPLHRLFGVTELRLESGGGAKPEAVMKVIRVADAQRLEQVLRGTPAHAATDAPAHEPRTLLSLATSDVLLLGLLNNRGAIVLGAAVGGLFQFQWWEKDQVREMFKLPGVVLHDLAAPAHLLGWMWTIALLVAGAFLMLKLFSVAVSLTTFFGFRLVRDGDRVATESGLLTRHGASARVDKLQRLTIGESLLARLAGRRWLSCDVAAAARRGDQDASEQRRLRWLVPLASAERIEAVAAELDGMPSLATLPWRALHPKAASRRFKKTFVLCTIAALAAALFFAPLPALLVWLVLVGFARLEARGWARFAAYACDDDVLAFRAGWLTRQWTIARIAKGQVLSVAASPFDRRHRMARVKLDTAGAGFNDFALDVPYLDEREAREVAARLRAAM